MLRATLVALVLSVTLSGTSARSMPWRPDWEMPSGDYDETRISSKPEITSLHIRSDISYRFATTHVTSQLVNMDEEAGEAVFRMRLPKTAFMTNFSMEIEGEEYNGQVKEKAKALKQYQKAKSQGETGAHVAATSRDSNDFSVSVNVAANKKVTFTLIYQEVLQRRLSHYEHVINIDPGQIVDDLEVKVVVNESRPITFLNVPEIKKDYENDIPDDKTMPGVVITKSGDTGVSVTYRPTRQQQQDVSETGLSGQFVVQYDVQRSLDAGEIQVVNGYFVHTFAPTGLPPLPKNVLFILDLSGSMWGRKIDQLKDAMRTILDDLRHDDHFNIITFDSSVDLWKPNRLLPVTDRTIEEAKLFTENMRADGATNIDGALKRGINFLEEQEKRSGSGKPSIIIFLTDGEPTVGETNTDRIQTNTRRLNGDRYAIFSIGFGDGVDFNFLRKLSLQNNALARKVYEASDAELQLKNFYKEVSIPLLSDVNITYVSDKGSVRDVTKSSFFNFFSGSELMVAGRVRYEGSPGPIEFSVRPSVSAKSELGEIVICPPGIWPPLPRPLPRPTRKPALPLETGRAAILERMWAYLTIQQLLDEEMAEVNDTKKASLRKKALELSLKFHFVTPLTSMVVTKPENPEEDLGNLRDSDDDLSEDDMFLPPPPSWRFQKGAMHIPPMHGPPGMPGLGFPSRKGGPPAMHGPPGMHGQPPMHGLPPMHGPGMRGPPPMHGLPPMHGPGMHGPPPMHRLSQPLRGRAKGALPPLPPLPAMRQSTRGATKGTTQAPTTMAPVADPTMTVALPSGGEHVCLSWPHMIMSSHTLFEDQGYKVIVGHDATGHVVSVSLAGPTYQESALISPDNTGLLLGTQFRTWGTNVTTGNVTLQENIVTFDLLTGVQVRVLRINQSQLSVVFSDVTGLSRSASGMLHSIRSWTLSEGNLNTPQATFSTSQSTVGDVTCKATAQDIFELTGTERRA